MPRIETALSCLALGLAACLPGGAWAQAGAPAHFRVAIEAPSELRDMLEGGLRLVRWEDDPHVTEALLERLVADAVEDVREAVATEGYFAPTVTTAIDRSTQPWTVTIGVVPGARTHVTRVDLNFTGPAAADPQAAPVLAEIRDGWGLPAGDPFRQEDWDEAKEGAVRHLSAWRYAAARVAESRATINPAAHAAELQLVLVSGPPYRIGPLRTAGLSRYPERVVANFNPVSEGTPYRRETVVEYQRRLIESGYFLSARAEIDPDPQQAEAAPLYVTVVERPSRKVEAGVAYDTDTELRADLRYRDLDLFGAAWRLRTELSVGVDVRYLHAELDLPPRPGGSWRSGFAHVERRDVRDERVWEMSTGVAHNWGLAGTPSRIELSVHADEQRIGGVVTEHHHAVFLGYRRALRDTDDILVPRKGYLGHVAIGAGLPGLSSRSFIQSTAKLALFRPLGPRNDLELRGQAGAVLAGSREGIPVGFLFRAGGERSVRGYAFESLGVREHGAVTGGRYMAMASAEYTRWLADDWGVAAFVDVGDAWDPDTRFRAAWGYGVGARLRTVIGPVRADLAYGQRTGALRLHLSAGFTF